MSDKDKLNTRMTLIQRAQDQTDEQAWAEFTEIYKNYIRMIVYKLGVYSNDREDIVQQVMVKVWQKLPSFEYDRDRSKFRTWLSSITHKTAMDYMRKEYSTAKGKEKVKNEAAVNQFESMSLPDVEEIAEREWKQYIVKLAMAKLTEFFDGNAIEVFMMSMDGKTAEEIADKLDIKIDSVYQLKARVKKRLNEEIKRLRSEIE